MGRLPAGSGARALVVNPKEPKTVYAAHEAGVYRSDDAGVTWQRSDAGLPKNGIAALALDPRQPERLFSAKADGAIYLSEDGAVSWQLVSGSSSAGQG